MSYEIRWELFDHWSAELAWWLGILYGDGNVYAKKGNWRVSASGSLSTTTRWLALIAPGKEVKPIKRSKRTHQAYVDSKPLFKELSRRFGLAGPKSKTLTWPSDDIPQGLKIHFIRGLWDSDGSLSIESKTRGRIPEFKSNYSSASKHFVVRLRSELERLLIELPHVRVAKESNTFGEWWSLTYGGGTAFKVAEFLYEGSPVALRNEDRVNIYQRMKHLRHEVYSALCPCGAPVSRQGFCQPCWWDNHGRRTGSGVLCSCGKPVKAKSMCSACYSRYHRSKKNSSSGEESLRRWVASLAPNMFDVKYIDLFDTQRWASKGLEPGPIYILSNEWKDRQKQCKGFISAKTGHFERRVGARSCFVAEVDRAAAKNFIDTYHIQGTNRLAYVYFGLFFEDELLGIMSLGRHNRNVEQNLVVLDRLCFKAGVQVHGGSSKLFSICVQWAKAKDYDQIISFSDNRWTDGVVYEKMGFLLERSYKSDYFYVKNGQYLSKQSQRKKVSGCPEDMTELQWAQERGLTRLYDAGKKRWIFNLQSVNPHHRPVGLPRILVPACDEKKEARRVIRKRYYQNRVANDKVDVWCDFCQLTHTPLRRTYEKNIKRNGGYVCERYGGYLAGKKCKENPYASEGKKRCNGCELVLDFSSFHANKASRDGRCARCKACMSKASKERYRRNKQSSS